MVLHLRFSIGLAPVQYRAGQEGGTDSNIRNWRRCTQGPSRLLRSLKKQIGSPTSAFKMLKDMQSLCRPGMRQWHTAPRRTREISDSRLAGGPVISRKEQPCTMRSCAPFIALFAMSGRWVKIVAGRRWAMPSGPRRFQKAETLHFITISCFHRLPLPEWTARSGSKVIGQPSGGGTNFRNISATLRGRLRVRLLTIHV